MAKARPLKKTKYEAVTMEWSIPHFKMMQELITPEFYHYKKNKKAVDKFCKYLKKETDAAVDLLLHLHYLRMKK